MRSRFKGSKRVKNPKKIHLTIIYKTLFFLVLIIIFGLLASKLLKQFINKHIFEKDALGFADINSFLSFSVDKITLYSSADAKKDESIKQGLVLNIHQFTDIAIYISNLENKKISELYIDNFNYSKKPDLGIPLVIYKNPLTFGKFIDFSSESEEITRIDFDIINSSDTSLNYSSPYVYQNLSNPVTLEYINKDVKSGYSISSNEVSLTFDGTLLKKANIDINKLLCNFSFDIHIKTSENEEYLCKINIPITLKNSEDNIYSGSVLQDLNTTGIHKFYRTK